MTPTTILLVLFFGLLIGALGGMIGLGGGIMVIPVLMFVFGFSQAKANGTSLAMLLPPIGVFAVLSYWKAGNIDWRFAGLLAVGFAVGAYAGARAVNLGWVNTTALRTLFGVLLLYIAGKMLFAPGGGTRAAIGTAALVVGSVVTLVVARLLGRHWERAAHDWGQVYRQKLATPAEYDYEI